MDYKISKELFEAVVCNIESIHTDGEISKCIKDGREYTFLVNDFFFKCKEWALRQGYEIFTSGIKCSVYKISKGWIIDQLESTSEQQAVFDACQWILEQLRRNNE